MKNKIDLFAPIVPAVELGNIRLSVHIQEYKELVSSFSWLDKDTLEDKSVSLFSQFHIGYELQDSLVMIFDVLTGKLQRVCAKKKYRGLLLDKLKIGMSIDEALKLEPRLIFDEWEEHYYIDGIEGVTIEPDVLNEYIEVITVYV